MGAIRARRIRKPRGLMDEHLTESSLLHRPAGLIDTDSLESGARTRPTMRYPKAGDVHHTVKVKRIMKALRNASEMEEDARFGVRSRTSMSTGDVVRATQTSAEAKRMGLLPEDAVSANMVAVESNIHTLSKGEVDVLHNLSQGMSIEEARPPPKPVATQTASPQPIEALQAAEERTGWAPGHGVKTFVRLFLHKEKPSRKLRPSGA